MYYPLSGSGEVWNGLTSVIEQPEDIDDKTLYIDGVAYRNHRGAGKFAGSIEAYSYPETFYSNVLVPVRPSNFGFSYRTGSYIHLVYNVRISPEGYSYRQSPLDPEIHRWGFTCKPEAMTGYGRISHLVIDTDVAYDSAIEALEDIIYGSDSADARLPLPDEVLTLFEANATLRVTDLGGGLWEIEGPDDVVFETDPNLWTISWSSVVQIDTHTYTISSF